MSLEQPARIAAGLCLLEEALAPLLRHGVTSLAIRGEPAAPENRKASSGIRKSVGHVERERVRGLDLGGRSAVYCDQRRSESDPDVERACQRRCRRRKLRRERQRGLEKTDGLAIGGTRDGLRPGLAQILDRLVGEAGPDRVVGENIDLLLQAVGVQSLDRLDEGGVQRAAPFLEQASVGDVVGQCVLERVLEIGKQASLVEELGRLELGECPLQIMSAMSAIASRSETGTSFPTTAAACNSRLSSGWSRSMRAARMAWTVAGIWSVSTGLASR
jgi:hypothetical protein